jgi:RNA polymerase sigma factor (sigma-70 family)
MSPDHQAPAGCPTPIQSALDRINDGDDSAWDDLIRASQGRLIRITRRLLRDFARLRRWHESDDVLHGALIRLRRHMEAQPHTSTVGFLCSAAMHIRRELLDMARAADSGTGPANLVTPPPGAPPADRAAPIDETDPEVLRRWAELHERIADMPEPLLEVFRLHWYLGLRHAEAARQLGLTEEAVRKRWMRVRLWLMDAFDDFPI